MPRAQRLIELLTDAIADDRKIDWSSIDDSRLEVIDAEVVQQLKIISAISPARPPEVATPPRQRLELLSLWYGCVLTLGLFKAGAALLAVGGALHRLVVHAATWPSLLNVTAFGSVGVALVIGGTKDRRGQLLGGLFAFIASAFADPLLNAARGDPVSAAVIGLRGVTPEAFLPFGLWLFVRVFPAAPRRRPDRRICTAFLTASLLIGLVMFAANAALAAARLDLLRPAEVSGLTIVDRQVASGLFWPMLFVMALPALPYVVWKSRFETAELYGRVAVLLAGFVMGLAPALIAVLVSPFFPALADPARRRFLDIFLYASVLSVVPITMYAVLVQQVFDVQLVLRKTMQHALARYCVWFLSIVPLSYALIEMYRQRNLTVNELLTRTHSIWLLGISLTGILVLTFRHQLLLTIDRLFQRNRADSAAVLARLDQALREVWSIREAAALLGQVIDHVFHPKRTAVLIINEEGSQLVPLFGDIPLLDAHSTIVDVLRAARGEIQIDLHAAGSIARFLPATDRTWLSSGAVEFLMPLVGSAGDLLGIVALGSRQNDLAYGEDDRMLLATMSGYVAVRLENRRLAGEQRARTTVRPPIDWENEPAACCSRCLHIWPSETTVCPCGGTTTTAALPGLVKGKFRVERMIGSGGMGVIYLALDLTLKRRVAIKTLSRITPDRALRLQREAQTMASVLHPNLAMIFGAETWRDIPLLIVEYLEGGTLAQRLQQGPLPVSEVIDLGVVLVDVLARIHAGRVLHRDIKPSNIGYTREGFPKLLDFGLAALLSPTAGDDATPASPSASGSSPIPMPGPLDPWASSTRLTSTRQVVGTPLYLSPEAVDGGAPEASFDLWSLNVVLFEALAGQHPFRGNTVADVLDAVKHVNVPDVRQYTPTCPPAVAAFFRDALARQPQSRPHSAEALRNQLQRLRADLNHPNL